MQIHNSTIMKYLFSILIALLILAGCSKSTAPDPPEDDSRIVGSWELSADGTKANWIGKSLKAISSSADSIIFDTPDNIFLKISDDGVSSTGELRLDFQYADSTFDSGAKDSLFLEATKVFLKGVEVGAKPFRINRRIITSDDSAVEINMEFLYTCGFEIARGDTAIFQYLNNNSKASQAKFLNINKFQTVLDETFCN